LVEKISAVRDFFIAHRTYYLIYPRDAERNGSKEPVVRAVKFFRFLSATRYSNGVAIHTHTALSSSSLEIAV
jgi:hypothetical protein